MRDRFSRKSFVALYSTIAGALVIGLIIIVAAKVKK